MSRQPRVFLSSRQRQIYADATPASDFADSVITVAG